MPASRNRLIAMMSNLHSLAGLILTTANICEIGFFDTPSKEGIKNDDDPRYISKLVNTLVANEYVKSAQHNKIFSSRINRQTGSSHIANKSSSFLPLSPQKT